MFIIPVLGKLRQVDHYGFELYSMFETSIDYVKLSQKQYKTMPGGGGARL